MHEMCKLLHIEKDCDLLHDRPVLCYGGLSTTSIHAEPTAAIATLPGTSQLV